MIPDVPTIDGLLEQRALDSATVPFLRFVDGDVTFADAWHEATRLAHGLAGKGVQPAQLVPVLMPNGPEFAFTWLALTVLGAVPTLLNTAFRGPALSHALAVSGATIVIADPTLAANVAPTGIDVVTFDELRTNDATPIERNHVATDPAMVLFTSGTTGPSKGCVLSHRYAVRQAQLMIENLQLRADDVLYCPFPMFHIDALVLTIVPAMVLATTAAIGTRFSASGFWDEIRRTKATVFDFMGATLTMLHKRPLHEDDADNPARLGWGVPVPPEIAADFERRFGVHLVELYGSTDAGIPIYHPVDVPRRDRSCGRAIPQYDVRLVDEAGSEVQLGDIGEIVVRAREPGLMSDGYYGMAEATQQARRDGWFHTGDLARGDEDGYFYFVGRHSDSIRRRGENISAFEVEEVVKLHPAVLDAAAYGVPSELTEDDVMVSVVPRPGHRLDPRQLIDFCLDRMAAHMVPR
ncbi:MAG TPA: AMP-binding protein, partial [Ilumatobacteraceae bacterium]|nr:AMP-binding protein [Ilumatobacteraceae bacterium]